MHPVLKHYIERLNASISRSALLNANVGRVSRMVDLTAFDAFVPSESQRLLDVLLTSEKAKTNVELPVASPVPEVSKDARRLHRQLVRRIARDAKAMWRETGLRSLWLGYPTLYAADPSDSDRRILSPMFLWPIEVLPDQKSEGIVKINRDVNAGAPKFNRAMAVWIGQSFGLKLEEPSEGEFEELTEEELESLTKRVLEPFANRVEVDLRGDPIQMPMKKEIPREVGVKLFPSGVLGIMKWENQALLADLTLLGTQESFTTIVDGYLGANAEKGAVDSERPTEDDTWHVAPTDWSQERAINQARKGPGVVIHGPPGTGKSQAIVNIVADALAHEERVLVVCQKRAAIEVVADRLKAAGLDSLFVEIHDSESDRAPTLQSLRAQADAIPLDEPVEDDPTRERLAKQISDLEGELDLYHQALFEKQEWLGKTYREVLNAYGKLVNTEKSLRPRASLQDLLGRAGFEELSSERPEIESMGDLWATSRPLQNPWVNRKKHVEPGPLLVSETEEKTGVVTSADRRHQDKISAQGVGFEISTEIADFPGTVDDWLKKLRPPTEGKEGFAFAVSWQRHFEEAGDKAAEEAEKTVADLLQQARGLEEKPLQPELKDLAVKIPDEKVEFRLKHVERVLSYRPMWYRIFYGTYRESKQVFLAMKAEMDEPNFWVAAEQLDGYLKGRKARQELRALVAKKCVDAPRKLNEFDDEELVAYLDNQRKAIEVLKWLEGEKRGHPALRRFAEIVEKDEWDGVEKWCKDVKAAADRCGEAGEVVKTIEGLKDWFNDGYLKSLERKVLKGESVSEDAKAIAEFTSCLPSLESYDAHRKRAEGLRKELLADLETYEKERGLTEYNGLGAHWWSLSFLSALTRWRALIRNAHPILTTMTSNVYAAQRDHLAKLLEEKMSLESAAIRAKWERKQRANGRQQWQKALVPRGRYAKRLREAVELGEPMGLFNLRPCWMMNPNTACQIFPLQKEMFDIVIFDEASQCPVEQALPILYRAKRVVIAGDRKQLPPTSFFTSAVDTEDLDEEPREPGDEPAPDSEEAKKALQERMELAGKQAAASAEDLLEASLPILCDTYLLVHYRSRHPSLIGFSNRSFYDSRLEIPPLATPGPYAEAPAISYLQVNGLYEKQTNTQEAQYVVKLLKEIWAAEKPPTVGVVTFNLKQRELIEDLLEDEMYKDEAFGVKLNRESKRTDGRQDVGFFVKNLESVQGDEREVIILCTTFGVDETGRFRRAFGPLNVRQSGEGWRRLNVVVTRAKQRVIVVTSMPIEEISHVLGTSADEAGELSGRDYLQLYLAYAKAVSTRDLEAAQAVLKKAAMLGKAGVAAARKAAAQRTELENEIFEGLKARGHAMDWHVGEAGFRIDLAVQRTGEKPGYALGIECDGTSYHADHARYRDIWRKWVLERNGWELHRVWSVDWWNAPEESMRKLEEAVNEKVGETEGTG